MSQSPTEAAIARIDAALARIEAASEAAPAREAPGIDIAALRARVMRVMDDLDELIAEAEQ